MGRIVINKNSNLLSFTAFPLVYSSSIVTVTVSPYIVMSSGSVLCATYVDLEAL